MKRAIIAQVLVVLLLTSCATTGRPEALAFTIDEVGGGGATTLSLDGDALERGGYRLGDWVSLDLDGVLIDALVAEGPHQTYVTVVAGKEGVTLHLPGAIEAGAKGILRPSTYKGRPHDPSVNLSGSFVFTF
jgi:hypothetical protein